MSLDLGTLVGYLELDDSGFKGPLESIPEDVRKATGKSEEAGSGVGSKIGSGIAKGIKGAATGVVTLAATGIGIALTKGFQRLESIDNARQKLIGLGHSAGTVDTIMGNALKSVKGTAFGLGDAATVAASATAAGIKPGKDLERTLSLVADAATIAGTDMGSMGAIFNKAAASNKVQMDVINQLHDAGVPALSALADHMGVTAEEASKMASAGKIDFATFQAAMEGSLGGAAQSSGATFSGAMANVFASLGRIGAGLMEGIFPHLAPLLNAITAALGPVEDKAAQLGEAIGSKVVPFIEKLIGWLEKGPGALSGMGSVIAPLSGAFIALGASGLAPLLKMVPGLGGLSKGLALLGGPIGLVVAAIVGLLAVSPELREALFGIIGILGGALAEILPVVLDALMPVVEMLGGILSEVLVALAPMLATVAEAVGGLLVTALEAISPILPVISDLLVLLLSVVKPLIPVIQFLGEVLGFIIEVIAFLLTALIGLITGNEEVYAALSEIWNNIVAFFITMSEWWASLWANVTSFARDAWNNLLNFFRGIPGWIGSVFASAGRWLLNSGKNIVTGLRDGVKNMWNSFIGWVKGLPGQIIGFFAGAGKWLWNAGKNVVQGLLNGVKSLAGSIGSFFLNLLPGWIVGPFKAALGIASPSKLFEKYGVNLGEGVILGTEKMKPAIEAQMGDLVNVPAVPELVGAGVGARGQGADSEGVGVHITIERMEVREEADIRKVAQELHKLSKRDGKAV